MQPTGAKKDFLWAVVTATATAIAVKIAELVFDTAREQVEKSRKTTDACQKKRKKTKGI